MADLELVYIDFEGLKIEKLRERENFRAESIQRSA
jgi:hypothetical protein